MGASLSKKEKGAAERVFLTYNRDLKQLSHVYSIVETENHKDLIAALYELPETSSFTLFIKTPNKLVVTNSSFKVETFNDYQVISSNMISNNGLDIMTFTNPNGPTCKRISVGTSATNGDLDICLKFGVFQISKVHNLEVSTARVFTELNSTSTVIFNQLTRPSVSTIIRDNISYITYSTQLKYTAAMAHLYVMAQRENIMTVYNIGLMSELDRKRFTADLSHYCTKNKIKHSEQPNLIVLNYQSVVKNTIFTFAGVVSLNLGTAVAVSSVALKDGSLVPLNDLFCGPINGPCVIGYNESVIEVFSDINTHLTWNSAITDNFVYCEITKYNKRVLKTCTKLLKRDDKKFLFLCDFNISLGERGLSGLLDKNKFVSLVKPTGADYVIVHNFDAKDLENNVFEDRPLVVKFTGDPSETVDFTLKNKILYEGTKQVAMKQMNVFNIDSVKCFTRLIPKFTLPRDVNKDHFQIIYNKNKNANVLNIIRFLKYYKITKYCIITPSEESTIKKDKIKDLFVYSTVDTTIVSSHIESVTMILIPGTRRFTVAINSKVSSHVSQADITIFSDLEVENAASIGSYSYLSNEFSFMVPTTLFMGSLMVGYDQVDRGIIEISPTWNSKLLSKKHVVFIKLQNKQLAAKIKEAVDTFNFSNENSQLVVILQVDPETVGCVKIGTYGLIILGVESTNMIIKDESILLTIGTFSYAIASIPNPNSKTFTDLCDVVATGAMAVNKLKYISDPEIDLVLPLNGIISEVKPETPFNINIPSSCTMIINEKFDTFTKTVSVIKDATFPTVNVFSGDFTDIQQFINSMTPLSSPPIFIVVAHTTDGINILNLHHEIKRIIGFETIKIIDREGVYITSNIGIVSNNKYVYGFGTTTIYIKPKYITPTKQTESTLIIDPMADVKFIYSHTAYDYDVSQVVRNPISEDGLKLHKLTLYQDTSKVGIDGPITYFKNTRSVILLKHPSYQEVLLLAKLLQKTQHLLLIVCVMENSAKTFTDFNNVRQSNNIVLIQSGKQKIETKISIKTLYTKVTYTNTEDGYYNKFGIATDESSIDKDFITKEELDYIILKKGEIKISTFFNMISNDRVGMGSDFIHFTHLDNTMPTLKSFQENKHNIILFVPDVNVYLNSIPKNVNKVVIGLTTKDYDNSIVDVLYSLLKSPKVVGIFFKQSKINNEIYSFTIEGSDTVSTQDVKPIDGWGFYKAPREDETKSYLYYDESDIRIYSNAPASVMDDKKIKAISLKNTVTKTSAVTSSYEYNFKHDNRNYFMTMFY